MAVTMRREIVLAGLLGALMIGAVVATAAAGSAQASPAADPGPTLVELQDRLTELEKREPNQAIAMTHLAYHFTNLWFAARHHNWPLADFYLGEARDNLKWAARIHPVREGPSGEVNVAGIAEAVDNTELSTLAKSVRDQRSDDFVRAYDETLTACYACHRAIGKPYLRPHRPTSPDARIIDFRMR
jgi:hypothetical protein